MLDLLSSYERTQGFLRFGAELGESSRQILTMGDRVLTFFDQPMDKVIPINLQLVLLALLVSGMWNGKNSEKMLVAFEADASMVKLVDEIVRDAGNINDLIDKARTNQDKLMSAFG